MGLFEKLFHPKQVQAANQATTTFKTLNAYLPVFTSRASELYEMELTRAAIDAGARHASKLKPEVIGSANLKLKSKLAIRPNPWQTTSQFLYRVWTIWKNETTCFIVPFTDATGVVVEGIYPALPSTAKVVDVGGEPWLVLQFPSGQKSAIEWARVGVLTKFQYTDDFFGSGNAALDPTLDLLDIHRQGMEEAVTGSAKIRFLARLSNVFTAATLKAERDRFAEDNLSSENTTGVMMFDNKYADVKQIEQQPWLIDANEMKAIKENVFAYFGVSEALLQNTYTEEAFDAFYEGEIEPFALQLGQVLTTMLFDDRELAAGNEVRFTSSRLAYASNATKIKVVTMLGDRGYISDNDAAEIFSLPMPPGPPTWRMRGEYKAVGEPLTPPPTEESIPAEGGDDASET